MKVFTASCIITTAFLVAWTRHRINEWEVWVSELETTLLSSSPSKEQRRQDGTVSLSELPEVVQTYLKQVVPDTTTVVRSVKIHQEGHFYFGSTWVPFEAYQTLKGVGIPGFVWDATISMTDRFQQKDLQKSLLPTMQVCDAFVGEQAYFRAALVNVFDSIRAKSTINEDDDNQPDEDQFLWVGEAMRWLAETVLVPTALLPQQGLVTWEPTSDNNSAILKLRDPRGGGVDMASSNRHVEAVRLEVEFDPSTGYVQSVSGLRPYEREVLDEKDDLFPVFTRKRTSWEWRRWEGRLGQYKKDPTNGLIVPHYMEAGWVNDDRGQVELYFMANNVQMDYDTMKVTTSPSFESSGKPNEVNRNKMAEAVVPESPDAAAMA
jgi:hypothetical protein